MVLLIKTYNILNHLHSLSPHVHDDLWYVHLLLFGGLAQSYVNGNQCPRPTNSSTACIYVLAQSEDLEIIHVYFCMTLCVQLGCGILNNLKCIEPTSMSKLLIQLVML
jgi:hypothetical protein